MKPPNLQSPTQVDSSSTCTQTLRNDSRPHFFYPWQHAGPRVSVVHWSGTFEMGDLFSPPLHSSQADITPVQPARSCRNKFHEFYSQCLL